MLEAGDPLWTVFVVDDAGVRFLPEYSVVDEEAPPALVDQVLSRSMQELPGRLGSGEFDRPDAALQLPDWILQPVDRPETEAGAWN